MRAAGGQARWSKRAEGASALWKPLDGSDAGLSSSEGSVPFRGLEIKWIMPNFQI